MNQPSNPSDYENDITTILRNFGYMDTKTEKILRIKLRISTLPSDLSELASITEANKDKLLRMSEERREEFFRRTLTTLHTNYINQILSSRKT